jgi:hypothetical protein
LPVHTLSISSKAVKVCVNLDGKGLGSTVMIWMNIKEIMRR